MSEPGCPPGFDPERILGHGTSAVVWLARHRSTGQRVAVKVWRTRLEDPGARDRFLTESRLLAQLADEPHIVEQLWASEVDTNPWTATRAAGTDLFTWVAQHPSASYRERLAIADGLLGGVEALHRRGLVHRDITPRNVLVDEDGHVRLCDLGLVMDSGLTTVDPTAGTPGYLAPELEAEEPPTPASDVWSAASVVLDLLGSDITPAVDHLVAVRALSHRPQDRPRDAGEFRRALATARTQDGLGQDEASAEAAEARARRHPWWRSPLPAAGLLLLAGIVGGVMLLDGPAEPRSTAGTLVGSAPATASAPAGTAAAAQQAPSSPTGPSDVPDESPSFPGEDAFRLGHSHPAVEHLDAALIRQGCTRYHDGDGYQPSVRFTEYTRLNVREFQLANPELDGNPDGYPGPLTWSFLFDADAESCRD